MSSWIQTKRPIQSRMPPFVKQIHPVPSTITTSQKRKVYYITNILAGGSYKYIKDLISFFPNTAFIAITNVSELHRYSKEFHSNDLLLVQYLVQTFISIKMLTDIVSRTHIQLVIPIHDFYFLSSCIVEVDPSVHNCYLLPNQTISKEKEYLLRMAKYVIFPSAFVQNEFKKHR